MGQPVVQLLEM